MEQIRASRDGIATPVAGPPAGDAFADASVLEIVDAAEATHPHRVVIDDGHRQLSAFLLGVMVRRLARAILDLAPPGPVGVGLREGKMGIVATLAILAAGRDCVLLDPARLPDAARGCAGLVADPRDGVIAPHGCVGIDVFLSCGATYAQAGPPLPDTAADAAMVRFGAADGEAFSLKRLTAEAGGDRAAHAPASGLLACPRSLGSALAALAAGGEIRIAGAGYGAPAVPVSM